MTAELTPVEEPERSSRAAGGCVLVVLVGVAGAVVFAVSAEAGILATVGAAATAVWWSVRRVPRAANPAPPPVSEGVAEKKPLFSVMDDPENPHHSRVVWHAREDA